MAETYPSDNSLLNLISESETGVEYIETGKAPYYLEFRKLLYRLLLATRRANDLRVCDGGGLAVEVKAGAFWDGTTLRTYAGTTGFALTDNATNSLYLDNMGTLTKSVSGYPAATVNHVRLATIVTSGGDITSLTDDRGQQAWYSPGSVVHGAMLTGQSAAAYGADGALPIVLKATLTGAQTVNIFTANCPYKLRVLDAYSVQRSANAATWKVTNGTNDIIAAVTCTTTDKAINRAADVDDATWEIAAAGTLAVTSTGASASVEVYIICMRIS